MRKRKNRGYARQLKRELAFKNYALEKSAEDIANFVYKINKLKQELDSYKDYVERPTIKVYKELSCVPGTVQYRLTFPVLGSNFIEQSHLIEEELSYALQERMLQRFKHSVIEKLLSNVRVEYVDTRKF